MPGKYAVLYHINYYRVPAFPSLFSLLLSYGTYSLQKLNRKQHIKIPNKIHRSGIYLNKLMIVQDIDFAQKCDLFRVPELIQLINSAESISIHPGIVYTV